MKTILDPNHQLVAHHLLEHVLAGHSYCESEMLADAKRNVLAIGTDLVFGCQRIVERGAPGVQTDREELGVTVIHHDDCSHLHTHVIPEKFGIVKVASSDSKRELFARALDASRVQLDITFTGWHETAGWGDVNDGWAFDLATQTWSKVEGDSDAPRDETVLDHRAYAVAGLEGWLRAHDDRLADPEYEYCSQVAAVRFGSRVAVFARMASAECFHTEGDKFVESLLIFGV